MKKDNLKKASHPKDGRIHELDLLLDEVFEEEGESDFFNSLLNEQEELIAQVLQDRK